MADGAQGSEPAGGTAARQLGAEAVEQAPSGNMALQPQPRLAGTMVGSTWPDPLTFVQKKL